MALPIAVTVSTVPQLGAVYHDVSGSVLRDVILFGMGWGVAQVFFGVAVDSIGIALTFSLVLGTSAAVGTLVPLARLHPDRFNTPAGHGVLVGVALVIVGVLICAVAGQRRERALAVRQSQAETSKHTAVGLVLAILCGFGASFINFGLAFGAPLVDAARAAGTKPFNAPNVVWLPLFMAGAIPNALYCVWLLRRKHTAAQFRRGGVGHWGLALSMAVLWFGSALLYGLSTIKLGAWGPILGWPVFVSLIVIVASLLGMLTGEWKHSGRTSLRIQWVGVASLVAAVFVLAETSRSFS